jgi:hypothetical protein
MPEYLAPGVYVEETSFRAKTIEGVSTSTAGFVGPARYGPINGIPELVTSLSDFERVFGTADPLEFDGSDEAGPSSNQLALGVRAFFDNGGRRVYVARIYGPSDREDAPPIPSPPDEITAQQFATYQGHAWKLIDPAGPSETLLLVARHPGSGGNFRVGFTFRVGQNAFANAVDVNVPGGNVNLLKGITLYDLVWVQDAGAPDNDDATGTLYWAERFFDDTLKRNNWVLHSATDTAATNFVLNATTVAAALYPGVPTLASTRVRRVATTVEVTFLDAQGAMRRRELWEDVTFHPESPRSLAQVFLPDPETRSQQLSLPFIFYGADLNGPLTARVLLQQLQATGNFTVNVSSSLRRTDQRTVEVQLENGRDGVRPPPIFYEGSDLEPKRKTGLRALKDIQDISIVAIPGHTVWAPGTTAAQAETDSLAVANMLISHAEEMRYRIAVLDSRESQSLPEVRAYRAQLDTNRAALYYPFVRILDPVSPPDLPREINLPPSGFITGIYARTDVENGVHKSPANEVLRGALGFEVLINKGQQDVLNPEGINVLRFFEGRGYRVWGARTITSDPEWKYVNVRRYFLYLERSIDRGTQWVVFENNGYALWANVRRTIEDFLFNEWKSGHLFGTKPEEAYFVRCDRTTMTQNDLDNGRLVCFVGVAPLRPAEFVIFRIGQKTADARS